MNKIKKWKLISSETAFAEKWFPIRKDTVELPSGEVIDDFFVSPLPDVALVVPVATENRFILCRQYKHGYGDVIVEFPAGYIEENEEPLAAARRELYEETGYRADKMIKLAVTSNNPTKTTSRTYVYLALELQAGNQKLDENENIEILGATKEEISEMISNAEFPISDSIAAFFLACMHLENQR